LGGRSRTWTPCLRRQVEHIREKMGKVMMERWGVPLLGVVPDLPYLGTTTLRDIEMALDANLLGGAKCRGLHYGVNDIFLVTTTVARALAARPARRRRATPRPAPPERRLTPSALPAPWEPPWRPRAQRRDTDRMVSSVPRR
jgi:hypothetical protein